MLIVKTLVTEELPEFSKPFFVKLNTKKKLKYDIEKHFKHHIVVKHVLLVYLINGEIQVVFQAKLLKAYWDHMFKLSGKKYSKN